MLTYMSDLLTFLSRRVAWKASRRVLVCKTCIAAYLDNDEEDNTRCKRSVDSIEHDRCFRAQVRNVTPSLIMSIRGVYWYLTEPCSRLLTN